jgi:hypothetical protein
MELTENVTLTGRDRAILRAVAAGHAEVAWGAGPDLFLDGRCCCDQAAVRGLAMAGLIAPADPAPGSPVPAGGRVPAQLTPAGLRHLVPA